MDSQTKALTTGRRAKKPQVSSFSKPPTVALFLVLGSSELSQTKVGSANSAGAAQLRPTATHTASPFGSSAPGCASGGPGSLSSLSVCDDLAPDAPANFCNLGLGLSAGLGRECLSQRSVVNQRCEDLLHKPMKRCKDHGVHDEASSPNS